jgi:hypothetical protein
MAGRLPAESAGDVVLEEMRNVGLESMTNIVEKIRQRRTMRHEAANKIWSKRFPSACRPK